MTHKIFNSISGIDKKQWNAIVPKNKIFCSYDHIRAVEESEVNNCEYRYIVFYKNSQIIGHACIYTITMELDLFLQGPLKKLIAVIRKYLYKNFLILKMVECGIPTAIGNTINITEQLNPDDALAVINKEMAVFAKEKRTKILLLRDFFTDDLEVMDYLLKERFKRLYSLPGTSLLIRWDSFDQYLKSLQHGYRKKIKKYLKAFSTSNIEIEILDDYSHLSDLLAGLWKNVYDHAREFKREILTPKYFTGMCLYLNMKAKIFLYKKDSKILGFQFLLEDDTILRPLYIGMDYRNTDKDESKLYFNMLIYLIKYGIEKGKKEIEMGITTIIPKMELGCEQQVIFGYMRHLSKIKSFFITKLFALFSPPPKDIKKNVFNLRLAERYLVDLKAEIQINNKKIISAGIKDISYTGIQIIVEKKSSLRKKQILKVMNIKNLSSYKVECKVIWIQKTARNFVAGLIFLKMDFEKRKMLTEFIDKQLSENIS